MRWLWRSTILPCKAHKNYHIPASLPFSTNMQWIYMRLTLTWVQRYRWCTLHNKSETKAVGGVIQHDGGVCHGDGNADFCCATARAWQHFVAMRKETVKKTFSHSSIVLVFQREAMRSFGSMLVLEFWWIKAWKKCWAVCWLVRCVITSLRLFIIHCRCSNQTLRLAKVILSSWTSARYACFMAQKIFISRILWLISFVLRLQSMLHIGLFSKQLEP